MPLHDWTKVSAGSYHSFHTAWIAEIAKQLNNGGLPEPFYAEAEQVAGQTIGDVLTLEASTRWPTIDTFDDTEGFGGTVVAQAPPAVSVTQIAAEAEFFGQLHRRLAIRHSSGDTGVAYIEIVSSGNRSSTKRLQLFVDKAYDALERGIHLLIIEPYPPGSLDPQGIHAAIWHEVDMKSPFTFPDDRDRTAVAYQAVRPAVAWIEPMAVGKPLPDMPVFITPDRYVTLPLEASYVHAYEAVPKRWRKVLET
jgi:hypothetical protein